MAQQLPVLGQKLNGPITVTQPTVDGQVQDLALVPDSRRAVFVRGESFFSNLYEVCVAPLDASALPITLSTDPFQFGDIAVEVEPTGAGAAFTGRRASGAPVELFRALLDGSAPAVRITAADTRAFQVTPDGQRILFVADHLVAGQFELFSAPVDGTTPPLRISGALVANGDVASFRATATRAVYVADQDVDGVSELYSVPVDGSAAPVKLNAPLIAAGDVAGSGAFPPFRIAPGGTRVVYRADQVTDQRFELLSVPVGGGSPVLVSRASGSNTRDYEIDPTGARVVFADRPTASTWEVLSAPLDGSAPPVTLSGAFIAQGAVQALRVTPDGARVLYAADQDQDEVFELFSAPLDGSAARVRIHPTLPAGGDVEDFLVTSTHVAYRADQDVDGTVELFGAPVDGSGVPVQLHPTLVAGTSVLGGDRLTLTADGQRVVFVADVVLSNYPELVSAPVDGSGPLVVLDPNGGLSAAVRVTPDDARVAYVTRDPSAFSFDSYSVPVSGGAPPVRFNESTFVVAGDVYDYALGERGDFALYLAAQESLPWALYATRIASGFPNQRLSADTGASVSSFALVPGGERAVYVQGTLHSARIDGSAPPTRLTDPLVENLGAYPAFTPDGADVVFRSTLLLGGQVLRKAPSDGASAPVTLSGPYAAVGAPRVTPDGSTAVFAAGSGAGTWRLYGAPLAPGTTRTLTGALDDAPFFELTPDGARVVYRDDTAQPGRYEVYSAPLDASAPPVRLNPPLGQDESVGTYYVWLYYHDRPFAIAPDSRNVVFVANSVANQSFRLFRAPADGSAAAVVLAEWPFVLDPLNEDGEGVGGFRIDPRGARVVYQTGDRGQLFSVPLDGSGPPVELTGDANPLRGVPVLFQDEAFRFAADGTRVVFLSDHKVPSNPHLRLYLAPLDGSVPSREISGSMQAGGDVTSFETDGLDAVFVADKRQDGRFELFRAPLSGGPVTDLSLPPVAGGRVTSFQARRGQVLYRGDMDTQSVFELYLSTRRKSTVR